MKKAIRMATIAVLLIVSLILPVQAGPPAQGPSPQDIFAEMKRQAGGDLDAYWDPDAGIPRFVTGNVPYQVLGIQAENPEAAARGFLSTYKDLYHMADPQAELAVKRIRDDELGMSHVRFTQQVGGVPVWGAEIIVHLREGKVIAVGGEYVPGIALDTTPTLTFEQAVDAARTDLGDAAARLVDNQSGLTVYARHGATALTWKVNLLSDNPLGNWLYFIHAHDGSVVHQFNPVGHSQKPANLHGKLRLHFARHLVVRRGGRRQLQH